MADNQKYTAQAKHLKAHYAQFKINLRPAKLEEFRGKCLENGTTPTTELKKFIDDYCQKN